VGYGVSVPKGSLPVFSVDSEDEAHRLLTLACGTNFRGEFVADELAREQTIDNLLAFGDRLKRVYEEHKDFVVG
jgi:hypothetical protein